VSSGRSYSLYLISLIVVYITSISYSYSTFLQFLLTKISYSFAYNDLCYSPLKVNTESFQDPSLELLWICIFACFEVFDYDFKRS